MADPAQQPPAPQDGEEAASMVSADARHWNKT